MTARVLCQVVSGFVLLAAPPEADMPKPVADLLQMASSTAPELEALALLRLAEPAHVPSRTARMELLRRAFEAAGRVQYPLRQRAVPLPAKSIAPPEYILAATMRHGVDRLSLEARAARAILDLNPDEGLRAFEQITLTVPQVSCEEIVVPDVSAYYATAAEVINRGFSSKQREREEDAAFAARILSRIQSPVELEPAVSMLMALKLDRTKKLALVSGFAQVMQRVRDDDRSFTSSLSALDAALRKKPLPSLPAESSLAGAVLKEYRAYVVRHLTAARCAESVGAESSVVRAFSGDSALTPDERRPAAIAGAAKIRAALPHLAALTPLAEHLFPMDPSEAKQRELMRSRAWRDEFDSFVQRVADLELAPGQSEAELAGERLRIMENVLRVTPRGPARDALSDRFMLWLKQSPLQSESWVEWYDAVLSLLQHADAAEREKILAQFEASGSAALVLIAALERL